MSKEFNWCKTDEKTRELEIELGLYENFEIHITGSPNIIKYFKDYNIPYLEIDMLDKDLKSIQKDYMCAIKYKAKNFEIAEGYARMIAHCAVNHFDNNIEIYRIKIETEPLEKYFDKALYIERHWEIDMEIWKFQADCMVYPLSYIENKYKLVLTERNYNKNEFKEFTDIYAKTELCLLDTNINHDKQWFDSWKN